MMERVRYEDAEGSFELVIAEGWVAAEDDEEGGLTVARAEEGAGGMLHIVPFGRAAGEDADPAEELYAFLEDQDIELEEDEVEDLELASGGMLALCEYEEEPEGEGAEPIHWLVAVGTGPGQLVFAAYSCPADEIEEDGEAIRRMLSTLTIGEAGSVR